MFYKQYKPIQQVIDHQMHFSSHWRAGATLFSTSKLCGWSESCSVLGFSLVVGHVVALA
jgi:hypothetical protein